MALYTGPPDQIEPSTIAAGVFNGWSERLFKKPLYAKVLAEVFCFMEKKFSGKDK
ncbi:MAG: hypothetical protein HY707_14020, partial [Ignavibacteriae bacterium]|nr:hypothetical protein [Ignavibacteriota bacterium]